MAFSQAMTWGQGRPGSLPALSEADHIKGIEGHGKCEPGPENVSVEHLDPGGGSERSGADRPHIRASQAGLPRVRK